MTKAELSALARSSDARVTYCPMGASALGHMTERDWHALISGETRVTVSADQEEDRKRESAYEKRFLAVQGLRD